MYIKRIADRLLPALQLPLPLFQQLFFRCTLVSKRKYDRITAAIRDSLHWLLVQQRIDYKLCVLVYKCLHQGAPVYLSQPCIPVVSSTSWSHLRSAAKECLVISYCMTKNYGQRSFSYSGPTLWNSLPLTLRDKSMSLSQFCSRLRTEMFCRAYNWSWHHRDSLGCQLLRETQIFIHTYIHSWSLLVVDSVVLEKNIWG